MRGCLDTRRGWTKVALFSLVCQAEEHDLIEVYKTMSGIDRIVSQNNFPGVTMMKTGGYSFTVRGKV